MLVLLIMGLMSYLWTNRLVEDTRRVSESTGEVLVATQQVSASLAEADAAAVSVHLAARDGNREQRRLYEQATERATTSLERVARLVGNDERSHDALQTVSARTIEYAGLIESARLASIEELPDADATLRQASAINRGEISSEVQVVAERARARFNEQTNASYYIATLVSLAIALLVLLAVQFSLHRRFRRLINVPIALATLVMLVLLILSVRGFVTQQRSFDTAEQEAFNAITVSEELQQNAYRHRSLATSSVLTNTPSTDALMPIEEEITAVDGLLQQTIREASSERERSAAFEISTRWDRYQAESDLIQRALASGDVDRAEALTQGPANSAFNGFNTSVEAALLDNREQFLSQLGLTTTSLELLRALIILGTLVAIVLTWSGFALRIGEYS